MERGEGVAGRVWDTGSAAARRGLRHLGGPRATISRTEVVSAVVGVPLLSGREVVGTLGMARSAADDRGFDAERRRAAPAARPARLDRRRQRRSPPDRRGGASRRGRRERVEERVPGHDEPRDPDADERRHRDDRPPARDASSTPSSASTRARSASSGEALLTIINDILDFSKIEAGRMELENAPVRPPRVPRDGARPPRRRGARRRGSSSPTRSSRGTPRVRRRRRRPPAADPRQPAQQRRQVHRGGRGRADRDAPSPARPTGAVTLHSLGPGHGDRHLTRAGRPAVPVVQPGRRVDQPSLRRHRARARHLAAARRADGRDDVGRERGARRARQHVPHDRQRRRHGRPAGGSREPGAVGQAPPGRRRRDVGAPDRRPLRRGSRDEASSRRPTCPKRPS